jgi:hypothetical protein
MIVSWSTETVLSLASGRFDAGRREVNLLVFCSDLCLSQIRIDQNEKCRRSHAMTALYLHADRFSQTVETSDWTLACFL